jgi:hypothetical protein
VVRPRGGRAALALAWTVGLAVATGCATGPRYRAKRPLSASNEDLTVDVEGLDTGHDDPGLVVVGRLRAAAEIGVRGASIARVGDAPCADTSEAASTLALDGAPSWQRPVAVAGTRRLRLDFPETLRLSDRTAGAWALDVATERAGKPGCLRVPIQQDDDRATWTPTSPWMLGVHIDLSPLGFGLGAGRLLGPVVVGLEDAISARWSTAALVAAAHVYSGMGLEASYAGAWALPGGAAPAGSFRNGPRLRAFYGASSAPRFDSPRVGFGGFGVEVAHWWAEGGRAASTNVVFGIGGWMNLSEL